MFVNFKTSSEPENACCWIVFNMTLQMEAQNAHWLEFAQNLSVHHILTNPIMDIAARFWGDERYTAAKICHQSMRVIDDLIDTQKAVRHGISEVEKQRLTIKVNDWVEAISDGVTQDSAHKQLVETIRKFRIPLWPWQMFSKSMIYDINHDGFKTFSIFLRYADGAAMAPASIFLHLCGVVKENGHYSAPHFDVRKAARPAGLFCYLVHIIRDFQRDQNNNLNYFANSLMAENGLNSSTLKEIAAGGEVTLGFRNLIKKYHTFAEHYRRKTRRAIDKISEYLEPRYRLSLEIVYSLYLLVFERIDVQKGRFTTAELAPSQEDVKNRLNMTIASFESTMHGIDR